MKKITLSILAFAASIMVATAQAPAKFNYQGIARNTVGAPLASKALGMRITVHDGSPTGAVVYQESQNPTTNAYGLYNVTIGDGTTVTGNLSTLAWGTGNKYIQVEIDVNGGTAYTDLGATQLLSVPYAMYAASGTAPTLTLSGTTLSAGGNTVTLPAGTTYTAGTGIGISGTNVISANLAAGTGITISGNTVAATNTSGIWNASQLQGSSVSATTPSTGQSLVWNGSAWAPATTAYTAGTGISITSGVISVNNLAGDVTGAPNATTVARIQGTSVATTAPTSGQVLKYNGSAYAPAADADAQTLSISGTSLSISGGNSVTLPTNSYTAGTGLTLTGTTFSANNTSAIWNANQIQSTGVSATAPTSGQALVYNGTNWTPTTLAAGSLYTGGTGITVSSGGVISSNNFAGDVTGAPNANTVARIQGTTVSATAPTNGQVLKYNGTNWTPGTDVDNDAQTLSLSGSSLSISGGNSVTLPTGTTYTAGTGIGISGSNVISVNNLAGDVTGAPNANTVTKLQGVAVSSTAPTTGQSLVYNGASWAPATSSASGLSGTTNYVTKFTSTTAGGNSQVYDNGTTVGIGTSSVSSLNRLEVSGPSSSTGVTAIRAGLGGVGTTGTGTPAAILGEASTGYGISGVNGNAGAAVYAQSNNGTGVLSIITGTGAAGNFDGGTSGKGILVPAGAVGLNTSSPSSRLTVIGGTGTGIDTKASIYGISNTAASSVEGGVFGMYDTVNYFGTGLQGLGYGGTSFANATGSTTAFGLAGMDIGIYGSGFNAGILGTSMNAGGLVGYSRATNTGGTVGVGNTLGMFANAVTLGNATAPATRYGIYAQASGGTTNWAGFFNGNVNVVGSIAKGSGTFKIDHPLDPEHKYLYHSFVESPDMMNIYNGNIITDANGYATVTMPSYFDALNKDFRYQLTVIGTFAQAIIKEKMNNNTFIIQTNAPNVEVSWMVTGVRHDKYADAHRVQPEVNKEAENMGKYVHPVEWDQPASKGISYEISHPEAATRNAKSAK